MDLKELHLVDPETHWYYLAKLVAIQRAVVQFAPRAQSFIDVGAGSGYFSIHLADFGAGQSAVCVDPNYTDEHEEFDGKLRFVRNTPGHGADVYLFIDVLEHVADPRALLLSHLGSAPPGATIVVTVPAFMSMWSAHDVYLEHFHRYTLGEVVHLVADCGLEVVHRQYLFGSIFPIAWAVRRVRRKQGPHSDLKTSSRALNRILTSVLSAEHRLARNPLAGLSAMVVAKVPDIP